MTSRQDISAMVSDWIAANGAPRRFDRGFSGDWHNMRNTMKGLGYELSMSRRWYTIKKIGARGPAKRMSRDAVLKAVDEILIAHGKQPYVRRSA